MTAGPWNSTYLFGLQDITTHHLDMPFYVTTFAFVMNKAMVDGLSPENRKVVDDHCTPEWAEKISTGWTDHEAAGRQRNIDDGHTLYQPTEAEVAEWKAAAEPLRGEWAKAVSAKGEDADAIWNSFVGTLEKYDSLLK